MLRERQPLLCIGVQPRSVVLPGRIGRGRAPSTAHGSQGEQRSRFAKTFFQPEIVVGWITDQPPRSIAEVGQRVAELVRKLKTVLRPVSVLSGQADHDPTTGRALEIGLRMIGTMIDIDTAELGPRAVAPNFKGHRLQKGGEISGTGRSKRVSLHPEI